MRIMECAKLEPSKKPALKLPRPDQIGRLDANLLQVAMNAGVSILESGLEPVLAVAALSTIKCST